MDDLSEELRLRLRPPYVCVSYLFHSIFLDDFSNGKNLNRRTVNFY
jgi:hypothetical protein